MKESLKTTFTIVGSVIGAGFISGRELVRFFGGEAFLPILILTFFFFFIYLYFLLRVGQNYGTFSCFLNITFKKYAFIIRGIFLICSFITLTAMLAGINALEPKFSPYISILTAIACFFIAKKGINGINTLNTVLVPVIVVYVVLSLVYTGNFTFAHGTDNFFTSAFFSWIYVGMNMFLSTPVVVDCGGRLFKKSQSVFAAGLSAFLVGGCMTLILSAISATEGASERIMPLLYVLKEGRLFMLISFFGVVTTLISAYYPLHIALNGVKYKDAARLFLLAAASFCATWGLDKIVETVYPVVGVLGIIFLFVPVFNHKFFQKHHQKIHHACQRAKNNGRRHHKVKFKHLPSVDD